MPEAETEGPNQRAVISNRIVQLHKEFYGRGPDKAKTYLLDDTVLVIMRGGFSTVDQTLYEGGEGSSAMDQRGKVQRVMRERLTEAITEITGRTVVAFMNGSHQDPDVTAEVFLLEPTDIIGE